MRQNSKGNINLLALRGTIAQPDAWRQEFIIEDTNPKSCDRGLK